MTTSLYGRMSALAWTTVILTVMHITLALLFNQALSASYFIDESEPSEQRLDVYTYFGTFSRSLLTMFEITLANWPPACRLLMENVNEWLIIYVVGHKLTIGFAVVNVVNAVFIQETFRVATLDDKVMIRHRAREAKAHVD